MKLYLLKTDWVVTHCNEMSQINVEMDEESIFTCNFNPSVVQVLEGHKEKKYISNEAFNYDSDFF